jgi:hypothetical protein
LILLYHIRRRTTRSSSLILYFRVWCCLSLLLDNFLAICFAPVVVTFTFIFPAVYPLGYAWRQKSRALPHLAYCPHVLI